MTTLFISALSLGLAGSLHCTAMCGPLLVSIHLSRAQRVSLLKQNFLHHFGRILSYATMGAIMGSIGQVIGFAGYQQKLALFSVLFLLVIFFLSKNGKGIKLPARLQKTWKKLANSQSTAGLLTLGIINGFIPCGLVYTALSAATLSNNALEGMLFMTLFGLGTLPILITGVIIGLKSLNLSRKISSWVTPVATLLVATFLILKGLGLDINYLSPKVNSVENKPSCCEH
jgi:uncharacterized protein